MALRLRHFRPRRARKQKWVVGATLIVLSIANTALLLWAYPGITSALWGVKVPSGQPHLNIQAETDSILKALVIPKTRHDDVRWVADLNASP
ncbi:hypothetical protein LTR17_027897, partial [Elasticomyces elasticus]